MSTEHATGTTAAPAEDAPEIVSAFPLPPAFFTLYRDGVDSGPAPPAPMEPQYHMFGTPFSTQDVVPDLLPMPGQKLYLNGSGAPGVADGVAGVAPEEVSGADAKTTLDAAAGGAGADPTSGAVIDYKTEMRKINHSLLANFTELVDVLIKKPSLFNDKLNDLELLFLNMHNLINTFRPHQARETIIHMLQLQIQERRDAAQEIRKTIDESRRQVEDVHGELHDHAFDELHRSQDAADIKMEDVGDDADVVVVAEAQANASAQAQSFSHGELSAKAREAQVMQQSFFSSLQAVAASSTQ